MKYDFGINGSLRRKENVDESEFYLFNAFGCMKAYSFDGERFGYYGYDASGERTYKMGFDKLAITTNQGGIDSTYISWVAGNLMLYPNGYMNINQNGEYTKHYYADALRIASKIGKGFSGDICDSADVINTAYSNYLYDREGYQSGIMVDELNEVVVPLQDIQSLNFTSAAPFCDLGPGGQETNLFFYHSDHLGSTGMVTDNNASVIQGLFYAPFGEIISDYNPSFHDTLMPNYAFNAKELDEENGMYYYSARYYAPPTFISRDPMFETYPSISPYTYCANNPLKFVDPTGMIVDPSELTKEQQKTFNAAMQNACSKSPLFAQMYDEMHSSDIVYKIKIGSTSGDLPGQYNPADNSITFKNENFMVDFNTFFEEFFHGYQMGENKSLYEEGKEFNYEFEAKIMKTFMFYESVMPVGITPGTEGFINFLDNSYGTSEVPNSQDVRSENFQTEYTKQANSYANYNKAAGGFPSNYQTKTEQSPKSMLKLFNNTKR